MAHGYLPHDYFVKSIFLGLVPANNSLIEFLEFTRIIFDWVTDQDFGF